MGVPYIDSGVPDIRDLQNVTLHNTKVNTLETIGTITGGDVTVTSLTAGAITGTSTTVTSLNTSNGPITAGAISGAATTVTSLNTSSGPITAGTISGAATTVTSLNTSNGTITGGVTSVTELKTNTISPATGQVTTTFPYDIHCRDINASSKVSTPFITAPNGTSGEIYMNSYVRMPSGMSSGTIWTNTIHAPTTGDNTDLWLKGGNAWACNILIRVWETYYRADRHYFYKRGNNFDNFENRSNLGVFFNGNVYWASDNRLKHNEEDITDALGTIRKLNAQKYQKTDEPKEADFNGELTDYYMEETGFIAQDVMEIPELAYCVTEGVTAEGKDIYNLKYNDIFVVNVQAVKELDAIVQSQQTKIDSLEARLTALESRN